MSPLPIVKIARHVAMGLRVGLCDLTRGELGSNGTVEERLDEAQAAGRVLGAEWRENLGWPDRVRSTARVAKRQEAAPCGFKWSQVRSFTNRATGTVPRELLAYDEASCRFATRPPFGTGRATRAVVAG